MSIVCDWMPNKLNIPQVLSLVNELVPSLVMPGPISGFREIFRQNKYLDLPRQTPDHREEIPPVPKQRLLGKLVGEAVAPLKRLDVIYRTFCGRLQRMSPRSKYHWTLAWIFFLSFIQRSTSQFLDSSVCWSRDRGRDLHTHSPIFFLSSSRWDAYSAHWAREITKLIHLVLEIYLATHWKIIVEESWRIESYTWTNPGVQMK